jgi:DHA2 family multidrug resistance protein
VSASAAAGDGLALSEERLDVRKILIVVSVMCAVLLEIIDTSIVNVALPAMMGSLGATLDEIDWIVTGYIVSNVIVIPMTGWMASRFGRKRYFVASILLFTASSLACGLSGSIGALVFWRIVQGLGGGALVATSQAILVETFPARQQGTAQALFGVGAMMGPSLGPTLGGFITDQWSWHWIFFINVPLGLAAAFLCASYLRDPAYLRTQRAPVVDWPGIALLVVAVGSVQMFLERGHKDDWFESRAVTALAVTTVVSTVALVWRELTTEHPIVDLRILRKRQVAVGCTLGAVTGMGLYGCIFLFPVFTQSLLGWNAWNSGLAILPSSLTTAAVMLFAGRLVWHVGPRHMLIAGFVVLLSALVAMSRWTLDAGWDQLFWPQVMRGFGMGIVFVPLSLVTMRTLAPQDVPKGAGLYNLFRQLGGSLGISLLTTLLDVRADVHRVALAAGVGPLEAPTAQALAEVAASLRARGLDPVAAHFAAQAAVDRTLEAHAMSAAFQDCYWLLAALFALTLPLGFLLSRHAPGKREQETHDMPIPLPQR